MNNWNTIYQTLGVVQKEPSQGVHQAIEFFTENGCQRILDLGCGTGRHTVLLADEKCEVYGCDFSQKAIDMISQLISDGHFSCCDMAALPYEDEFFDALLCHHVLQHGMSNDVQQAICEIKRVLRPGGYLALTVISTEHPKCATGYEIEPHTRMDTDSIDGRLPHHFFSKEELHELFSDCNILRSEHVKSPSELDPEKESAAWVLLIQKSQEPENG